MSSQQMDPEQAKFNPGISIVLIFFVSVFCFTAIVSLYIRQCTRRRHISLVDGLRSFRRSQSVPPPRAGLDPTVVNTFPTFLYCDIKRHKIGQGALECAVCLFEFKDDDENLRLLPKCSHVFHLDCIDAWLAIHVTCPVCRANLAHSVPNVELGQQLITLFHESDNSVSAAQPDVDSIIDDIPRLSPDHKFARSHSTGHSVIQIGENCDRFTLRLPEEVRSQLVISSASGFKRSPQKAVVFPTETSSRRGYRSSSVGTNRGKSYENYNDQRFDQAGRSGWNISRTPPFISRAGSSRSPISIGGDSVTETPKTLMNSIKSPLDRFLGGKNKDDGEDRSTRWLIPDGNS